MTSIKINNNYTMYRKSTFMQRYCKVKAQEGLKDLKRNKILIFFCEFYFTNILFTLFSPINLRIMQ